MNYKRKSRRRLFLLVRSRTPPISSEFRGGVWTLQTPPLGTPLQQAKSRKGISACGMSERDRNVYLIYYSKEWGKSTNTSLVAFVRIQSDNVECRQLVISLFHWDAFDMSHWKRGHYYLPDNHWTNAYFLPDLTLLFSVISEWNLVGLHSPMLLIAVTITQIGLQNKYFLIHLSVVSYWTVT